MERLGEKGIRIFRCVWCGRDIDVEDEPFSYDADHPFCDTYCWTHWVKEATEDD